METWSVSYDSAFRFGLRGQIVYTESLAFQ